MAPGLRDLGIPAPSRVLVSAAFYMGGDPLVNVACPHSQAAADTESGDALRLSNELARKRRPDPQTLLHLGHRQQLGAAHCESSSHETIRFA